MLFAHRGFVDKNCPENSIASLKKARELGFKAIEFDIWFLEEKLILSHNNPKTIENLPNLSDYFIFKNQMNYWLDFKNLNEKNAISALELLKKIIEMSGIELDKLYFAPFVTNYKTSEKILTAFHKIFGDKVNYVAVCEDAKNFGALYDFMKKNNIKFLSIFHELINKNFIKKFKGIEIFAWTVNDENRLRDLQTLGVEHFATDRIIAPNIK